MTRVESGGGVASGPALRPEAVLLPGTTARLRAAVPLLDPQDVPRWMTGGGAAARAAAAAMAADAAVVRRVGDTVRAVLGDVAVALGWQGGAADAARARVQELCDQLVAVAGQFDAAQDAFTGLAAALDAEHPVLGSATASWAHSPDPDQRLAQLRQWQPAVRAVDEADGRSARALRQAAGALERVHLPVTTPGSGQPAAADDGGSLLADGLGAVGSFCADTVNALASFANAMGNHPDETAQMLAGLLLTEVGASGEALGTALDVTGVGALVGVPVNMVAGGAVAVGTGTTLAAVGRLAAHAAGDDHVTPMASDSGGSGVGGGGGAGGAPTSRVDIANAQYAQRTAGRRFSRQGSFQGRLVDDVVADLRAGRLTPQDVPIDVIVRDGKTLILNTRSATALEEAGIPRTAWKVADRTGQPGYEARLTDQLRNNNLDSNGIGSVRVKGRR